MLEAHPRCAVSVVVQIVNDDGGALCAAANCMSLALVHAGVPMRQLAAGVSLGLPVEGLLFAGIAGAGAVSVADHEARARVLVVDLAKDEEAAYKTTASILFGSSDLQRPLVMKHVGAVDSEQLLLLLRSASAAASPTLAFLNLALKQKVIRDSVNFAALPLGAVETES